jgi:2-methylisocitrate lyase-like PEP mutase family enzyme
MPTDPAVAAAFLDLHRGSTPLLLANAWDLGTAKALAAVGFQALATTSAGHAASLGRTDGNVTRDEAIEHGAALVGATDLPVSADLENGFADAPEQVAETVRMAIEAGLAGCSIEDWSGSAIYDAGLAKERVAAAVEAAGDRLVLTARAENHIRGVQDLDDTIARLQSFQEAGAHVLYAPGRVAADDIRRVVGSVDRPVNVLALPGVPPVAELGEIGVGRISLGSGFTLVAFGALVEASREILDQGTYGWWATAAHTAALGDAFD